MRHDPKSHPFTGILVAAVIVAIWIGSLEFLSFMDIYQLMPLWILPAILGRTFIQTGLFIVAHDAIHGSVLPLNRRLNDSVGWLAVTLYAFLDYQKLALNHWQHHLHPGQSDDPDFHDELHFIWYLKFMKGYLNAKQIVIQFLGIGITFLTLHFGLHIPVINLFLFWVLPIFLSTIQLFFFGTYLPHRIARGETEPSLSKSSKVANSHHATSSNYPLIWSFLTCYHFGYHWEHHEYPTLPWYSLPTVRQVRSSCTEDCD